MGILETGQKAQHMGRWRQDFSLGNEGDDKRFSVLNTEQVWLP